MSHTFNIGLPTAYDQDNAIGRFCYVQKKEGSAHPGIVPSGEEASHSRHALFRNELLVIRRYNDRSNKQE